MSKNGFGTKLGRFLNQKRIDKCLSLRDAASLLGFTSAWLSNLEHGFIPSIPAPDKLTKLSQFYDVSIRDLLLMAGYPIDGKETFEARIQRVYDQILRDPTMPGQLLAEHIDINPNIKEFIVYLYEKLLELRTDHRALLTD